LLVRGAHQRKLDRGRKQTTLWSIPSGDQDTETEHCTQKPVECIRRPIQNNSLPDDTVYDPFLGSGTTPIAAESTGRTCLGMELEPHFVEVAIQRWQAFSGSRATLSEDGHAFDEVAQAKPP
jgi:DNA modification methylase